MNLRAAALLTFALYLLAFGETADSTAVIRPKVTIARYDAMPKDPLASTLFSATICGTGQLYNQEYLRGIITGAAFWASFFGAEYLMYRWQQINTDTVYLTDYFDNTIMHPVYVMRPDNRQVGLPPVEKTLLVTAVIVGASAYVFGLIDSYRGAQRFNKKLFSSAPVKPEFYCAMGAKRNEAGLRLLF